MGANLRLGAYFNKINMVVSVTFLMVNLNNFIDSTNTFFRNIWKNSPHKLNSFCVTDSCLQLENQQQKRQDLFPSLINSTILYMKPHPRRPRACQLRQCDIFRRKHFHPKISHIASSQVSKDGETTSLMKKYLCKVVIKWRISGIPSCKSS